MTVIRASFVLPDHNSINPAGKFAFRAVHPQAMVARLPALPFRWESCSIDCADVEVKTLQQSAARRAQFPLAGAHPHGQR